MIGHLDKQMGFKGEGDKPSIFPTKKPRKRYENTSALPTPSPRLVLYAEHFHLSM